MKVISVVARKGGVGKTTFTYIEANYLANTLNKKILLIDGDPQANLSSCFLKGYQENSFGNILTGGKFVNNIKATENDNIHIVSSNLTLDETNELVSTKNGRERVLARAMELEVDFLNQYDYIIFDTNPSFSWINKNIMYVSDSIVLIADRSRFSLAGILGITSSWNQLCSDLNISNNINTIILNKINDKRLGKDIVDYTTQNFKDIILKNHIREYATIEGSSVYLNVDKDLKRLEKFGHPFKNITDELLERGVL